MRQLMNGTAALALAGSLIALAAMPATAQVARPQATLAASAVDDIATPVRWRGRGGAYVGAGIVAGALLGGAIAASRPYYYGPGPYYYGPGYYYDYGYGPYAYGPPVVYRRPVYGGAVAYCMRRFRSYDPASGTYLGYDGYRHPCP